MTTAEAKRIIVVSVMLSGALASVAPLTKGNAPDVRIGVGVLLLAVFLLTLAEFVPQIAGMLGLLALASTFFAVGPETYKSLTRASGRQPN